MTSSRKFFFSRQPAGMGMKIFLPSLSVLLIFVSLLFTGLVPAAAQAGPSGPADPAELGAFMDGLLASQMEADHVRGAVVVVVKDGEVFFAKGYGFADLEGKTPVDPAKTLFRPGSVSKLFTWTSVMQLVEQGKLSLDADVNTYLDFKIPATHPEPITLKNLMTHTPGFEDIGEGLFKLKEEEVIPLEAYLKQYVPARVFPPGKIGAYSNYGTALAGYIVERISGMPFYEYVEKNILAPLGMEHATFRQPLPSALAPEMSGGFNYVNGGFLQGGFEYVVGSPAGALSAAGLDMARFMIAHLQNGRYEEARILQEETARQMHSPLYSPDPRLSGMAYGFFETTFKGQYVISHGGDTFLFHSGLFLLPEQNLGLFVSTNSAGGARSVEPIVKAFMDRYYPVPQQPALVPDDGFASRAPIYSGSYYFSRNNFTTIEKILMLLNPISVSVDRENRVILSIPNQVSQMVETEPGLLVDRENPNNRWVMKQEDGQTYLFPSSPFVLIKAPASASLPLHLLILLGGALLFLGALVGWGISFLRGLIRRQPGRTGPRMARLAAALFGLGFLAFIVLFGVMVGNVDPAYGVPSFFFEVPSWFGALARLPVVLALLAAAMLVFALLAWWKRYWTAGGRLFYSLLALFALAAVWSLSYWNFL